MNIHIIRDEKDFPEWLTLNAFKDFLHTYMVPYEDEPHDIEKGLGYAFGQNGKPGGFIVLGEESKQIRGAVVMLKTGMGGYIPENLLLFACVNPAFRGQGIGRTLIEQALDHVEGDVKLHVEYDNPAKRLYERIGFTNKYAEMRLSRETQS